MRIDQMRGKKIGIIGAGSVGATAAYSLAMMGICDEIVLYDIVPGIAIGKALDIGQAAVYSPKNTVITGAIEPSDMKECDIVVITAGVPRKGDMTRADLLLINVKIIKETVENIKTYSPNAIIICVSNPLDVLTYSVYRLTGWDRKRIIGMAGALDSARMAYQINAKTGNIIAVTKAVVLGEHGQSMIPYPKLSSVGGVPLDQILSDDEIADIAVRTRDGGAEIVKYLGTSAYYAPGRAVSVMIEAILSDSRIVIPSTVILEGEYGYRDVAVGVPVVLGEHGIEEIIQLDFDATMQEKFKVSVNAVKEGIALLEEHRFFD